MADFVVFERLRIGAVCAAGMIWLGAAACPMDLRLVDLFERPAGPRGLEPTAALRESEGRRVRLAGYLVVQETPSPGYFLLTPRPVRLSEDADGDADDLPPSTVRVDLPCAGWQPATANGVPVTVTGILHFGRRETGDGRVTWVRLDADTPATEEDCPGHPPPLR